MIDINQAISTIELIISGYPNIKAASNHVSKYLDTLDSVPVEITNYLKGIVQKEALSAWVNHGMKGIIVMATGTGKSKIVVDWLKATDTICGMSILIVPTEKLRDNNWREEFIKWNQGYIYDNNLTTFCYASVAKIENSQYINVIIDEAHNITESNSNFFANNKYSTLMALTATYPKDPIKQKLLRELGLKVVYELPLDIAVKLRLVSPYEIIIVHTKLDNIIANVDCGTKKTPNITTELKGYQKISGTCNKLIYATGKAKMALKMYLLKRMRFIYNLPSKLAAAKYIKSLLPSEDRTLIFTGSINHAEELSQFTYHSKSKSSESLDKFISRENNELVCVEALNEGINIPEVHNALIVQLNSNPLNTLQRIGRIIRYTESHVGRVIIICCLETMDVSWVKKALESLDKDKIRIVTLEDLVNGVEKL